MQRRRLFLSRLFRLGFTAASSAAMVRGAWAQRPSQPIARPPGPPGSNRPFLPGRFSTDSTVATGAYPGVFTIVAIDADDHTLQLRDGSGRTGLVHIKPNLIDITTLQPGDQVEVDFVIPEKGSTKLEAGAVWKVAADAGGIGR
jgi:hypothetical protein